jgi:acid phosphatase
MNFTFKLSRRLTRLKVAAAGLLALGAVACGDLTGDRNPAETLSPSIAANTPLGSRVKTTGKTNVQSAPSQSGSIVGTQPKGALGTLVGGPVKDTAGDNHVRWQVDFDTGPDGWVDQGRLNFVSGPTGTVASVTVTPAVATVSPGGTVQLSAVLKDASGNPVSGTVAWTSGNTAVATVSASGLVSGVAAGSATITATSSGHSGTAAITVSAPTDCVTSGNSWVNKGFASQTGTFTAEFDATPGAASIDGVTGLAPGTVTDYTGLAAIVRFNTSGTIDGRNGGAYAAAQSIAYTAGKSYHIRLVVDVTNRRYSAYVTPAGGAELTIGTGFAFRSEQSGATALADWGAMTSIGTMSLCNFTVSSSGTPAPVATVTVSPASASVAAGSSAQFTATLKDANGNILTGRTVTWASSNTAVATISSGGLAQGVAQGTVTITATSETRSGTASLTVTAASGGSAQFGHVVIVVEENTNYSSVIGSSAMPYLNSLASQYGYATQFYANTHPSIGNYFMMTTGQIITNNDSYASTVTADNVVRRLIAAGKTWKAYAEDLPSVGYLGFGETGNYASKHNPIVYFSDVRNDANQAKNVVPFTQFATDLANNALPNYSFVVPNLCNDAHDCGLSTADTWLKNKIAPLLTNPAFQQDGLLIITFDESGSDNTSGGGRIAWVVVSPKARTGYRSTTFYQHQSTLRLMLEGLGLTGFPGAAASAPVMGEFFNP